MDADPLTSNLGHFVILQFAMAVVAVVVALGFAWRAFRGMSKTDHAGVDDWMPPQIYFQGPIREISGLLSKILRESKLRREQAERVHNDSRIEHERAQSEARARHGEMMGVLRRIESRKS